MFGRLKARRFVLDGELLIASGGAIAFDALQLRLHPAASRVAKLAAETPAMFMAFDCLGLDRKMLAQPSPVGPPRRRWSSCWRRKPSRCCCCLPRPSIAPKPLGWLKRSGGALDGVIAKRLDQPYRSGERAMVKVKQRRTADCVVGGFRYGRNDRAGRLAAARPLRRRRPAPPRRLHLVDRRQGPAGLDQGTDQADRAARLHRQCAGRTEPLVDRSHRRMAATEAEDRRSKCSTTRLLRAASGTAPGCCAGGRDKSPRQCTCDQLAHPLTPAQLEQLIGR